MRRLTPIRSRRLELLQPLLLIVVALAVAATPVSAQTGIGGKIKEVYELTKTAKTEQDYTTIIDKCSDLRKQAAKPDRVEYLTSLLSWGLNKRGELYASQAIEAEDADNAAELDALALQDFESAVVADTNRWRSYHNRGVSYALQGRSADAEKDFTTTLKLNPKYAHAWFNRAEIRSEAGRYEQAVADYTEVLRMSPEDVPALRGRALCRLKTDMPRVALQDLDVALKLQPSSELFVIRGQSHQASRQWKQAAADFRAGIETDKTSAEAYRAAGWLMATCPDDSLRNPKLALTVAERAVALEEQQTGRVSGESLDVLAAAHAAIGNPTKAAQHARSALELLKDPAQREAVEKRLKLYQQGQPFRLVNTQDRMLMATPRGVTPDKEEKTKR